MRALDKEGGALLHVGFSGIGGHDDGVAAVSVVSVVG